MHCILLSVKSRLLRQDQSPVAPCDGLLLYASSGMPQKPFAGDGFFRSESGIFKIT